MEPTQIYATNIAPTLRLFPLPNSDDINELSFKSLYDDTLQRLQLVGACETGIPPKFSKHASINNKFHLTACEWLLGDGFETIGASSATARCVYIRGLKTEILNTWIFPRQCDVLPVFAAELILVGGVVRVAFIDIQTPYQSLPLMHRVHQVTQALYQNYSGLRSSEAPPNWAIEASMGNYMYVRQGDSKTFPLICDCYEDYLEAALRLYDQINRSNTSMATNETSSADCLHAYQIHHMNSSPGKKFLSNLFGEDWTLRFLENFLFARIEESK